MTWPAASTISSRVTASLCYYCSARLNRLTGLMFVDSGVEKANKQKAYRGRGISAADKEQFDLGAAKNPAVGICCRSRGNFVRVL